MRNQHAVECFEEDLQLEARYNDLTPRQMANYIRRICRHVDIHALQKNHRGPKNRQPRPKERKGKERKGEPHFST